MTTRSDIMRAVKSFDTGPEKIVRKTAHRLGYRFRLQQKELPGKPDLVFASRKAVILVHGCFWHGHTCKRGNRVPKTNRKYWIAKIARNVARDRRVRARLRALGWRSAVIWECQTKDAERLATKILKFLQ